MFEIIWPSNNRLFSYGKAIRNRDIKFCTTRQVFTFRWLRLGNQGRTRSNTRRYSGPKYKLGEGTTDDFPFVYLYRIKKSAGEDQF